MYGLWCKNSNQRLVKLIQMSLILKEHVKNSVLTISLCDKDILGKRFEEKNKVLDLSTSYCKGDEVSTEIATEMLLKARSATIVGLESTNLGKVIFPDSEISKIKDIPFMNVMKF